MAAFVGQFNWIDLIISTVVIFYSLEGYTLGFVNSALDLLSFIVSFIISLKTYTLIASLLAYYTQIPPGFAKAIGFFLAAMIIEIILNILFGVLKRLYFPQSSIFSSIKNMDKILGIAMGIFSAFVLLAFFLTLVAAFPLSPYVRNSIASSKLSNLLVSNTQDFEKSLNAVFGGAVNETISFLTIEPENNELIQFNFKANKTTIDNMSERKMFEMVNRERTMRGFKSLTFDTKLRDVGRVHCKDMFERGYFSHYTPEGFSPFDRMGQADISFFSAGENLAFSQNVNLAMNGLMQSPGHRENILSPNFGKIGVGVIDGGIYGEMFCQEFTD